MGKNWTDYQFVNNIERVSPKKIVIYRDTYDTEIDFNTIEECLDRFIELKNEMKEAMTFGESY